MYENQKHDRNLDDQGAGNQPKYTNKEISELLPEFSGEGQNINIFIERINAIQRAYNVMQLICIGKLIGQAKKWYQSKVEFINMNWNDLKKEMIKMYIIDADIVALRHTMERRRWKKAEAFATY